jgi:ABC-type transporter Mla subunit MlaD
VKTKARTPGGVEYEHEDGEVTAFTGREVEALESERGTLAGVIVRLERMLERSEEAQDELRRRHDELYQALRRAGHQVDGAERKLDELAGVVGLTLGFVAGFRPAANPAFEANLQILARLTGRETP